MQRRLNFTVFVVLLLFAFIYWTVVFVAVRTCSRLHLRKPPTQLTRYCVRPCRGWRAACRA